MIVQEVTAEDCREALMTAGFGRLACASGNQPYIVPIFFAFDGDDIYSFSMPGQKIEWMRINPHVCLEIDDMKSQNDWTSVIVFGRYEELEDTPDGQRERSHAYALLQKRAMWWQPGSVPVAIHDDRNSSPVFYRIRVAHLTGHRAVPTSDETVAASATLGNGKGGWLKELFHPRAP